jgi:hypothetical protein
MDAGPSQWKTCRHGGDRTKFQAQRRHVRRLLRFGYLAPDIEAIMQGRQPRSLTVKRLLQGIPCAWSEQRAAFGFTN